MSAKNAGGIYKVFENVKASEFWNTRFNFGKISSVEGEKFLTQDFVDLILINAVLPVKYTYHKNSEENIADEILDFYRDVAPEKNTVTAGWSSMRVKAENALQTQALLHHHKNYCEKKNCLDCGIGFQLLRNN